MEKVYKRPIDNLYSHSFYSDLFSDYEYSLSEGKINGRDFYIIIPDDKEIVELFGNGRHYVFHMSLVNLLIEFFIAWLFMERHIFS